MLKGKTAVITGSTSGIGLGIARAMAGAGANVMFNGFGQAADIEQERAGIANEFKVKALYSAADMTKPAEIAAMIKTAEAELGSVDILVNNAGIQHVAPIEEFPLDKWDAVLAINLMSAFHTIRAAVPGMKARKWGRIINTASAHSLVASPFKAAYITAKHGLVGLSKTVALELATFGVTCELHFAGLRLDPAGREADPRPDEDAQHDRGAGQARRAARRPADKAIRDRRAGRFARALSRLRRRGEHHRGQHLDRRRLDGAVNGLFTRVFGKRPNARRRHGKKRINLALQGGGAHGAFTWGVLDHLLEDGRLTIDGISGASAGAVNAVILADGLARGGPDAARQRLAEFWRAASFDGALPASQRAVMDRLMSFIPGVGAPMQAWVDAWSRFLSPYDLNPLNINPLKDLIERFVDFDAIRKCEDLRLFVSATNVHTGQLRVFSRRRDHRRRGDGVSRPAPCLPRRRNRRRALLGRRLHRQSADFPAAERQAQPRRSGGADQPADAADHADFVEGHPAPDQ